MNPGQSKKTPKPRRCFNDPTGIFTALEALKARVLILKTGLGQELGDPVPTATLQLHPSGLGPYPEGEDQEMTTWFYSTPGDVGA